MSGSAHPEPPFVAYTGQEPFLFVSFAHADADAVYEELRWLRAEGVNIWYDEGIGPGHVWPRELARAIDASRVVLIFISRNSVASANCLREVHFAIEHGKPLLAVHLDECELPADWEFVIGDRQSILKPRVSQAMYRDKLLGALAAHLTTDAPSRAAADGTHSRPHPRELQMVVPVSRLESSRTRVRIATVVAAAAIVVASIAGIVVWQYQVREERARALVATAMLEAEQALGVSDWMRAYRVAEALPDSVRSELRDEIWSKVSVVSRIATDPDGAEVSWRPYHTPTVEWKRLGTTPVQARLPFTLVALRLERDGYEPRYISHHWLDTVWKLQPKDGPTPEAVHVVGGETALTSGPLYKAPTIVIADYLIDKFELTNRQFQEFVDGGGYKRKELWEHPFEKDGRRLEWEDAMAQFKDRTGETGPSTWEVGTYPEGKADYPVTGVSWYEAAAYARFVGRALPTLYHWFRAADLSDAVMLIPQSNVDGKELAPVGAFSGFTSVGAFDMAGNSREWVANASGELRYTVGGGWNDPSHAFHGPQPQAPFDRSATNGFRLMTNLGDRAAFEAAAAPIDHHAGDYYSRRTPVPDEVFASYRDLYQYVHAPLNAVVEKVETVSYGVRERITFDAGYKNEVGNDRMVLYLLRPKDRSRALQTIVYFPGYGALTSKDIEVGWWTGPQSHAAFLVKSGRTVAFPVYNGTFERGNGVPRQLQGAAYLGYVAQVREDLGRSLDYLETRADVVSQGFGYFGFSWGGTYGAILLAVEPRLKAAVLYVAGLSTTPAPEATDPFNFAPRVHVPVLIVNARYDQVFPLQTHAQPLFDLLGTDQKQHYVSEGGYLAGDGGHFVPTPELARETIRWFDRYLGPTR
jgi:dienelactone hydrolase